MKYINITKMSMNKNSLNITVIISYLQVCCKKKKKMAKDVHHMHMFA